MNTRERLAEALCGADLIVAERRRQIEVEGWTTKHDAEHGSSRLLRAAEAYEWSDLTLWPWGREWWKPKDALSNLIRAGALFQAASDLGEHTEYADARVARCAKKIDVLLRTSLDALLPLIDTLLQEQLADYRDRLTTADDRLGQLIESGEGYGEDRLRGKREGVQLALSYLDETARIARTFGGER